MEISFSSNSITRNHIATQFGICHDIPAVVPCAKFCSDHLISIWMRAKWNWNVGLVIMVMRSTNTKWIHCHLMMTSPNGTFFALLALCAGNSPVTGEFPSQRPVTRSFDVFFDLRLNKRLSKQSRRRWFETPSCSLWRHCNVWPVECFRHSSH